MRCMNPSVCRWWRRGLLGWMLTVQLVAFAQSQVSSTTVPDVTAEEQKEKQAVDKFLELLVKRPAAGTALQRVFGYHVQRGTIAPVIEQLQQTALRSNNNDEAGRHFLLVGLLQLERGEDAQAVKTLDKAQSLLKNDPIAAFHYAQALLLVGNPDAAAIALESAIARKPARNDYLNIARELGRLYQRAGQTEDALHTWSELEKNFPGDDSVRSRIAATLVEEGDLAGALIRYDALAKTAKTENDRISFALEAARLRSQLGQQDQALKDFDALLARLRPGSYLYDEARRRVESIFLSRGDLAGLTDYYQRWLQEHPDDLHVILRTARTLSLQGRSEESIAQFESAIQRAPNDESARLACIEAYMTVNRFSDAATQCESLIKLNPKNPDYLVRYGQVVLSDIHKPETQRAEAAAAIWKRLTEAKPKDAAAHAQVADLLRAAKLSDEAIEAYRTAIVLAPQEPQYKEYLGEYLYQLKRTDEALAVWRTLVEGQHRNLDNLVRLAEVLHQFEQPAEALATMEQACQLKATAAHRLRYVEWLNEAKEFDKAYEQLELARQTADSGEDRSRIFAAAVSTYQASGKLAEQIDKAVRATEAMPVDSQQWRQLALLHQADGNVGSALHAIEKAVAVDPRSIDTLELAARMMETAGRIDEAIDFRKQLVDLDRRFRSAHLQRLASLYVTAGQTDLAIATGKELLASASGAMDAFRFYADLCGKLGRTDERLDTLRRCLRLNPRSHEAIDLLASQLADDFKTDQAIELVWKQLDLAEDIEKRRSVVARLADLYLRSNRVDQLISRLEFRGRESNDRRTAIDLIATAYQQVGDLGLAREALEGLLRENGRDTLLLERLVALSEQAGQLDRALELQRELVQLTPIGPAQTHLASLMVDMGAIDEAQAMWLSTFDVHADPSQFMRAIQQLFAAGEANAALNLTTKLLDAHPNDWEMLTIRMILAASADEWDIASRDAQALLALSRPDEEESKTSKQQKNKPHANQPQSSILATSNVNSGSTDPGPIEYQRLQDVRKIASIFPTRFDGIPSTWQVPIDLGAAKLLAQFLMLRQADQEGTVDQSLAELKKTAMSDGATADDVWKWYQAESLVAQIQNSSFELYRDPETWSGTWRLWDIEPADALKLLSRHFSLRQQVATSGQIPMIPLSEERLQWLERQVRKPTVQSTLIRWPLVYVAELKIAKKHAEATEFLRDKTNGLSMKGPEGRELLAMIHEQGTDDELWQAIEQATEFDLAAPVNLPFGTRQNPRSTDEELLGLFMDPERIAKKLSLGPEDAIYRQRTMQLADHMIQKHAMRLLKFNTIRLTSLGGSRQIYHQVGNVEVETSIDFPPAGLGPDDEYVVLLHQMRTQLKSSLEQWIEQLAQPDVSTDPRVKIERLAAAAYLQQWNNKTDEARGLLEQALKIAVEHVPQQESTLRLLLADLLLRQDRKPEALAMIEQLSVVDQNTMALREFAAARLAVVLDNKTRAEQATRRLIGVRLDTDAQIQLARLLRSLNMNDLASDVVRRLRGRSGSSNTQLQSLLRYFDQNDKEAAIQVAREILQRSAPTPRRSGSSITRAQSLRMEALQTLADNGQLQALIETTRQRLDRAPNSQRIRAELAEMYQKTGQVQELDQLLNQGNHEKVASTLALEAEARELVKASKWSEACDVYLRILRRNPKAATRNNYPQIERTFSRTSRLSDLADVILEVGIQKFESGRVTDLCAKLIRNEQNFDKGRQLFRSILNAPQASRNKVDKINTLQRDLHRLINDESMMLLITNALIRASTSHSQSSTWSDIFAANDTEPLGRKSNCLTALLRYVKDKPEMVQSMERRLREELAHRDQWREGKIWLGLLMATTQRYNEAKLLLEPLVDSRPRDGQESLWLVCSLIDTHPALAALTDQLYEQALKDEAAGPDPNSSYEEGFENSLAGRMCEYYLARGNKARAKELILQACAHREKLVEMQRNTSIPDYEVQNGLSQTISMMQFLFRVDAYVEALQVASELDEYSLQLAESYNRSSKEHFNKLLREISTELKRRGGDVLLSAMIDVNRKTPMAVDLGIRLGDSPFTGATLKSLWQESLAELANKPEQAPSLRKLFEQLKQVQETRPEDVSVRTALALTSSYLGSNDLLRSMITDGVTPGVGQSEDQGTTTADLPAASDPFDGPRSMPATVEKLRDNSPARCLAIAYLRWCELQQAEQGKLDVSSVQSWLTAHAKELLPDNCMQLIATLGKRELDRQDKQNAAAIWSLALDATIGSGVPPDTVIDLATAATRAGMQDLSLRSATTAAQAYASKTSDPQQAKLPPDKTAGSLGSLLGVAQVSSEYDGGEEARVASWSVVELDRLWTEKQFDPQLFMTPLSLFVGLDGPTIHPLEADIEDIGVGRWRITSGFDCLARRAHQCGQTAALVDKLTGIGSDEDRSADSLVKRDPLRVLLIALAWLRDGQGEKAVPYLKALDGSLLDAMSMQLIFQTLLAGLEDNSCRPAAIQLGLAWMSNDSTDGYGTSSVIELALAIARSAMEHKLDKEQRESAIALYLDLSQLDNARYREQHSLRITQLEKVAQLYLDHGLIAEAFVALGKRQPHFNQGWDRNEDTPGAQLLADLYANDNRQEAYRMLADWTFQGDANLNSIVTIVYRPSLPDWIPETISGKAARLAPMVDESVPLVSSLYTLALLATETQQQDDLLARYQAALAQKRVGSLAGMAISLATWKRPVPAELLQELSDRLVALRPDAAASQPRVAAPLAELQLALILHANGENQVWVRETIEEVARHGMPVGRQFLTPWLSRILHQQGWSTWKSWQSVDGLQHWLKGTTAWAGEVNAGKAPAAWMADGQGQVAHVCGHGSDWLWWRYPLEGNFEFEFETQEGSKREIELYAGGLRFTASRTSVDVRQDDAGDWLRYETFEAKKDAWNKHTLTLDDKELKYSINGSIIYKEARSPTPIFLALQSLGAQPSECRNVQFRGQPRIARSVQLISGDHLRGWSAAYYAQVLVTGNLDQTVRDTGSQSMRPGSSSYEIDNLNWLVDNHEIVDGERPYSSSDKQSLLQYSRPLSPGEKLEYEFYYEPGKFEVHPSLGRTAFLLRSEGVERHWMTESNSSWKIPPDNRFPMQNARPIALRAGEWNKVVIDARANEVSISVNDQLAAELPWQYDENTMFGLFHVYRQTKVRVRNVTLRGSWPDEFPSPFTNKAH